MSVFQSGSGEKKKGKKELILSEADSIRADIFFAFCRMPDGAYAKIRVGGFWLKGFFLVKMRRLGTTAYAAKRQNRKRIGERTVAVKN